MSARGCYLEELSEDGKTRLMRRTRKLTGEARAVADRLWDHLLTIENSRSNWIRDHGSVMAWGRDLADQNAHLRTRCTKLYEMLTAEQKAELLKQDNRT